MAAYLSYSEYQSMGGTLDATTFADLEYEAESYVNWYTFNRLANETTIPDAVKKCIFHVMKLIQTQMGLLESSGGNDGTQSISSGVVASQSNDGVSISYNILSAKDAVELAKNNIDGTISRYLQGVTNSLGRRLLYRGIYPDE